MPLRDSRINQVSNPEYAELRHELISIDRSTGIGQRGRLVAQAGAWRNVGSDCLVGGTRGLETRVFYSPFGNIRFSLSEVTTPTLSHRTANSCDLRWVKSWFLSCVGRQWDAITTSNTGATSSQRSDQMYKIF